jgi:hypothetical protein
MRTAYESLVDWELDLLNHAIESEWFHVRANLKLLEGFRRKRRIETRETGAATLKQSKVDLKTEKLALLAAFSHHGLVRYNDLEGVFDV